MSEQKKTLTIEDLKFVWIRAQINKRRAFCDILWQQNALCMIVSEEREA